MSLPCLWSLSFIINDFSELCFFIFCKHSTYSSEASGPTPQFRPIPPPRCLNYPSPARETGAISGDVIGPSQTGIPDVLNPGNSPGGICYLSLWLFWRRWCPLDVDIHVYSVSYQQSVLSDQLINNNILHLHGSLQLTKHLHLHYFIIKNKTIWMGLGMVIR